MLRGMAAQPETNPVGSLAGGSAACSSGSSDNMTWLASARWWPCPHTSGGKRTRGHVSLERNLWSLCVHGELICALIAKYIACLSHRRVSNSLCMELVDQQTKCDNARRALIRIQLGVGAIVSLYVRRGGTCSLAACRPQPPSDRRVGRAQWRESAPRPGRVAHSTCVTSGSGSPG